VQLSIVGCVTFDENAVEEVPFPVLTARKAWDLMTTAPTTSGSVSAITIFPGQGLHLSTTVAVPFAPIYVTGF
jgi:hypothetical protein